ncbi:hypothetical protein [Vibrio owensii]|uniref:hypothetical protein n=1 Tax=Vibrio owensii TaxID=696485 RepID=UPI001891CE88|nr:hypothetical protein [Vibrio owensii]
MLHGLKAALVISVTAAILAALSKSGVPPLLGFLSKEYMYKSGLEVSVSQLRYSFWLTSPWWH